jgi:hypothetical protein
MGFLNSALFVLHPVMVLAKYAILQSNQMMENSFSAMGYFVELPWLMLHSFS